MLLAVLPAQAATLTVGPSSTYATIAEAEAVAVSGDVIELEPQAFAESLAPAGRDLTYQSTGAWIEGVSTGLSMGSGIVVLEGVGFQGCTRAVDVSGSGRLRISDAEIGLNSCDSGCAIRVTDSATVEIDALVFADNAATDS